MDELEFRRRLYADPTDNGSDIRKSIKENPANARFYAEMQQLNKRIDNALHVDVPENLRNNLILKQTMDSHRKQSSRKRWHLAVAASVAFMVGLGVNYFNASPVYTSVADYSLAHYYHEEGKFDHKADGSINLISLNDKMRDVNASFNGEIGKIVAVKDCYFDGMDSVHLVIEGKYDNITVFVIPKAQHLAQTQQFADSNIHGRSQEYQQGEVIILGDKREPLDIWQQKIDATIEWSI
ncbi:DUF3379 family protein [Thalassotalea litorea]|uniref:DUF3379 family protein n=1 Tax=Thalassotalea litorea TaxID=2020715 RepID=UPI0037358A38